MVLKFLNCVSVYATYSSSRFILVKNLWLTKILVSSRIVMNLVNEYLDFGRTLYVDNWYTSVSLAHHLLERKTHLAGTLRSNRKYNPDNVIKKKLKKGQVIAQKSSSKVIVLKFKD